MIAFLLVLCVAVAPILFLLGIIVVIIDRDKRKLGLIMILIALLIELIGISICSSIFRTGGQEKEEEKERLFAVENFELIAENGDTSFVIYVNKKIGFHDLNKIRIGIHSDSSYSFGEFPIGRIENGNIVKVVFPYNGKEVKDAFIDSIYKQKFNRLIRNHLKLLDTIQIFDFRSVDSCAPNNRFFGNMILHRTKDFLNYNPRINHQPPSHDCETRAMQWVQSLYENYQGKFDKSNLKQGKWGWRFSNGNIMATTEFKNDKIIAPLKLYYYTGELMDSITFSIEEGKIIERSHKFNKDGTKWNK